MPQTIPCTMSDVTNFLGSVEFSELELDAISHITTFMTQAGFAPGKFNRNNLAETPQSLFLKFHTIQKLNYSLALRLA